MSAARRRFEWQLSSPSNLIKQHFDYDCHPPFLDMLLQSISLQHNRRDSSMQNILFGYEFLRTHGSHFKNCVTLTVRFEKCFLDGLNDCVRRARYTLQQHFGYKCTPRRFGVIVLYIGTDGKSAIQTNQAPPSTIACALCMAVLIDFTK